MEVSASSKVLTMLTAMLLGGKLHVWCCGPGIRGPCGKHFYCCDANSVLISSSLVPRPSLEASGRVCDRGEGPLKAP